MRSRFLFILSFSLFTLTSEVTFAQAGKGKPVQKPKDEIAWHAGRKLIWSDFKGKVNPQETKYALTTSDISVGVNCDGTNFTYKVNAVFVPSESWTRSTDSDALLAHEQLHFDITELHARKMKFMFSMLPKPCLIEQKEIQKLIDTAFQDWHKMEIDYDKATNHGLNKPAQKEWQNAIAVALQELEKVK